MIDEPNVDLLQAAVARCVRVATRLLPADVAEDVGQEAWIGLLQASGRGESLAAEDRLAFLIGIFHNLCADAVRKYERRRRHLAFESEIGESPLDPVDRSSARIDLEELIERVVRPILSGLDRADADLWIEAKVMGVGWKVAGEACGMGKAAIARSRKRFSRFLGSGDIAKRFINALGVEPRTPTSL
jgi:DNA-directed RNA polymerase specialized sigma24 family protein